MKSSLRKLFGLVVATGCIASLASCDKTDYSHTIVFYSSQGDKLQQETNSAIAAFEAANPGWTVKHETQGGYDDVKAKCIADLSAKKQPDLAYCYADHVAEYLSTGKVADMKAMLDADTALKADLEAGGFLAEGLASNYGDYARYGYASDAMLTLPFSKSTELMYYNASALESLGLSPAETWDELWQQAELIKEEYPAATTLGYDSEANWFITMCEQNGWAYTDANAENHYQFNNEECANWLDQLKDYYLKGYFTTQQCYGSYTSNIFALGVDGGATGCVYSIGSSGGAGYQWPAAGVNFKVGVAKIPASTTDGADNPNAVISQGPSLVMFETSRTKNVDEKKEMTFKFIKYLLDGAFQCSFSSVSGYNPVVGSAYDAIYDPDADATQTYAQKIDTLDATNVAKKDDMALTGAKVGKSLSEYYYASPAFKGSSTARTQVGNAIVSACTSDATGEEILLTAFRNCGGVIAG